MSTDAPTPKVYVYGRFSTPEQKQGDSERRQIEAGHLWATKRGLEVDTELELFDRGKSAFRSMPEHLKKFIGLVLMAEIAPGSVLVLESLDRFSRNDAHTAIGYLSNLVDNGITIVTTIDGKEYSKEKLKADPFLLIAAVVDSIRAHEESAKKSKRLQEVWKAKRSKLEEHKVLTSVVPNWLYVDTSEGKKTIKADPEKAKVVKRIFDMALEGRGLESIAVALNADSVPTFGRAKYWNKAYVKMVLESEAVFGRFTPHKLSFESGKKVRVPQEPIDSYYPKVVTENTFKKVKALRGGGKASRAHTKYGVQNSLANLAKCSLCGSGMGRVTKGNKERPKLVCLNARSGGGCKYHSLDLLGIEKALKLHGRMVADEAPTPIDHTNEIIALEAELDELVFDLRSLSEELRDRSLRANSVALKVRREEFEQLDQRATEVSEAIKALKAQQEASVPKSRQKLLKELSESLEALSGDTESRQRANTAMKLVMDSVVVDPVDHSLTFHWKHGGSSSLSFDTSGGFEEELKES